MRCLIFTAVLASTHAFLGTPANQVKSVIKKTALSSVVASTNLTAVESTLTYVKLGPFDNHVEACKACYAGHTRTSVVKNCICTAFTGSDGPTLFCTASAAGVGWSKRQDGSCMCTEKNMAKMGATTCDPHE